MRAELLRLRKWPAMWVAVGAWLFLAALFGYLFNYLAYATGDESFSNEGATPQGLLAELLPANVPDVMIQGTPMFGGALMMVLGAIVAGNGYGWGTWKTVLTQGPSRTAVTLGSIAATSVVVGLTVLATLGLSLAISTAIAASEGQTLVWPSVPAVASAVGVGFLVLEMWMLAGYLLGTLARGPALSVGLGLVWALVLENLLRGVGALLDPVEAFTRVLPGTAAGSLVGSLIEVAPGGDGTPGVLDALSGPAAAATVSAYLLLLPLATLALVRRRDVV